MEYKKAAQALKRREKNNDSICQIDDNGRDIHWNNQRIPCDIMYTKYINISISSPYIVIPTHEDILYQINFKNGTDEWNE